MTQIAGHWWGLVCSRLIRQTGRLGLWYKQKTLIWVLKESAVPRLSPIVLTEQPECFGARAHMSAHQPDWYHLPKKSISFNQNQFPTLTPRYWENGHWAKGCAQWVNCAAHSQISIYFLLHCDFTRVSPSGPSISFMAPSPRGASVLRCWSRWVQMERSEACSLFMSFLTCRGAGDLLFISLTPLWCADLAAPCAAFTARPPAVYSRQSSSPPALPTSPLGFHTAPQSLWKSGLCPAAACVEVLMSTSGTRLNLPCN